MEPIQDNLPMESASAGLLTTMSQPPRNSRLLPAKGSCWYCEKPVDSVRRFCDRECKDSFDEEQQYDA